MSDDPNYADWRRAAAFMTHRARLDIAGMTVIATEAHRLGRLTQLLRAVDAGYRMWVRKLRTDVPMVVDFIDGTARTQADPAIRLAALAIAALSRQDGAALVAALTEDGAPKVTAKLIADVADVYTIALPELTSTTGQQQLAAWTDQISGHEHDTTESGT